MKKKIWCCLLALGIAVGCKTPETVDTVKAPKVLEQDDASVVAGKLLADQYMAHYLPAVEKNDFSLLEAALPEKLSKRDQRTYFSEQMKWIREKLGVLKTAEYVDVFRKGALCEYLWKLTFEKEFEGKLTQVDLPYLVRTVRDERGEVKIMMVGFVIR